MLSRFDGALTVAVEDVVTSCDDEGDTDVAGPLLPLLFPSPTEAFRPTSVLAEVIA